MLTRAASATSRVNHRPLRLILWPKPARRRACIRTGEQHPRSRSIEPTAPGDWRLTRIAGR